MPPTNGVDPRRGLPSVDQAMQRPEIQALVGAHGRPAVLRALRLALDELRGGAASSPDGLEEAVRGIAGEVAARLLAAGRPSLRRVVNATGVVVHTNLGRAPLSPRPPRGSRTIASSYCNLEYDLERGRRGDREAHAEARLRALLSASRPTVVVNNCAAAVLLAVNTLAEGREVLVSRGELVEIGGSFRIPDVLRKGGARLREVGTTNRTRLADFEAAISPADRDDPEGPPQQLPHRGLHRAAAGSRSWPGSRARRGSRSSRTRAAASSSRSPGALASEATAVQALQGGADVVTFSGDKLLGGPQAGLVAGRRAFVEPMRRNPLYRALRVDKMTLAALDATLVEHESGRARRARAGPAHDPRTARARCARGPRRSRAALAAAAPALHPALVDERVRGGRRRRAHGRRAHGGRRPRPRPGRPRPPRGALRQGSPPVVVRVAEDRLLVDLRTVRPDEEEALLAALAEAARAR